MERLDDIIRGKLTALDAERVPGAAPAWDELGARLDGEVFDASLRDALVRGSAAEPLAGAAVLPDWDALADRLEAADAVHGEAFDRLLADKLARSGAPTSAEATASWRRLSHRMDTFWPLRRRLVRYRALEVAAAAAVVLTLLPMLREASTDPAPRAAIAWKADDRPCDRADVIARRHLADVEGRITRLEGLRRELVRMVEGCAHANEGGAVAECRVIETLANHAHCVGEHGGGEDGVVRKGR